MVRDLLGRKYISDRVLICEAIVKKYEFLKAKTKLHTNVHTFVKLFK